MELTNMKIAEIELTLEQWGDEGPESNWQKIQDAACFTHKNACEFIIHVGSPGNGGGFRDDHDLSPEILEYCKLAYISNFNYVCFIG